MEATKIAILSHNIPAGHDLRTMGEATVNHIDRIALHHPMKNPIGHIDPLGLTKSLKDRQGHIALNDHMTITIVLPMKSHIVHIDQQ